MNENMEIRAFNFEVRAQKDEDHGTYLIVFYRRKLKKLIKLLQDEALDFYEKIDPNHIVLDEESLQIFEQ